MKINSVPQSGMVERYKEQAVQKAAQAPAKAETDRVELSGGAQSFSAVLNEVKAGMETASENELSRFELISKQIQEGTYRIDSRAIAGKMLGANFDLTI